MTSLDPSSKEIAYSNLVQVIRSRTARGFVPNYSAGGTKSVDRTEPPIGAKVRARDVTLWRVTNHVRIVRKACGRSAPRCCVRRHRVGSGV